MDGFSNYFNYKIILTKLNLQQSFIYKKYVKILDKIMNERPNILDGYETDMFTKFNLFTWLQSNMNNLILDKKIVNKIDKNIIINSINY